MFAVYNKDKESAIYDGWSLTVDGAQKVGTEMTPFNSSPMYSSSPEAELEVDGMAFEDVIRIVVPIIFSFIGVLGFVGNLSVIVVVASNLQMRSTTNTLIISLAVADLLFIVTCVPFTAVAYAIPVWPFGSIWCKIYQYAIHVTAYISVYTLVLMSLDRYLAVVHPIRSMTLRTPRNATIAVVLTTSVVCLGNLAMFPDHDVVQYNWNSKNQTTCVNHRLWYGKEADSQYGCVFYGLFFALAYAVPLGLVCLLYGLMLRRLRQRKGPSGSSASASKRVGSKQGVEVKSDAGHTASSVHTSKSSATNERTAIGGRRADAEGRRSSSKRRVTRLVVVVVVIFAAYWLPFQVIMVTQFCSTSMTHLSSLISVKIAANCLAYMNSCVNPILYAFLSEPFRKSFRRLLICRLCCRSFKPATSSHRGRGDNGPVTAARCGKALLPQTAGKASVCQETVSPLIDGCSQTANGRGRDIGNGNAAKVRGKTKYLPLPTSRLEDGDLSKEVENNCDSPLSVRDEVNEFETGL